VRGLAASVRDAQAGLTAHRRLWVAEALPLVRAVMAARAARR
jgi:hypothetical protein